MNFGRIKISREFLLTEKKKQNKNIFLKFTFLNYFIEICKYIEADFKNQPKNIV